MQQNAHVCKQEGKIGAIEATLQHQSDADNRIENNLKDLIKTVNDNQTATQTEFRSVATNFSKLETILQEQRAATTQASQVQQEIKDGLDKLSTRVSDIETDVKSHAEDISDLNQKAKDTEERLSKIEKWILRIVALITALGLLVEFFSNVDSIKNYLFPAVKAVTNTEQQSK